MQSNPSYIIGEVQTIVDDNTLYLTSNAPATMDLVSYGRYKVPDINDIVNIGNPVLNTESVTVIVDTNGECHQINFTTMAFSNTLTHQDGKSLFVRTSVNLTVPSTATNTNTWNINNGSAQVQGNVVIGRGGVANRIAHINIINGLLEIGTNLVFNAGASGSAILDMSGGVGRINLGGNFVLTNTGTSWGTFIPGTNSTFCYCSTSNSQTVNFTTTVPAVTYANLHFGNTTSSGVTIPANITATNVKGNVVVERGLFHYTSRAITGNAGKIFSVKDSAVCQLKGTSTFPSVFTYNLEPESIIEVRTTANTILPNVVYGHLFVISEANNVIPRFAAGDPIVQGNLIVGNGINTMTLSLYTNNPNLYVYKDIIINPNATFGFQSTVGKVIELRGNWINNGGSVNANLTQAIIKFTGTEDQEITGTVTSQSFPNVEVNKPSGELLVSGSINAINTNALTITKGEFVLPNTLNLNNNTAAHLNIESDGILTDNNTTITLYANWINNGGIFNYGNSKVIFAGGNIQYIQGSSTTQQFNDVEINKTGQSVRINNSINQLIVNNFVQRNVTFLSLIPSVTVKVNGTFDLENTAAFNGTNITYLYLNGDIIKNSTGAWTMSQNVYLNGNSQQIISGSSNIPAFTNLTIDNSSITDAILTNKPLTVNGTLTLTRGQLVTDATNILEMGASSNIVLNAPGGDQALSFVKGLMIHNVNTTSMITKVYPVGDDSIYHRIDLIIKQTATTLTKYTGQYFNSSASALGWTLPTSLKRVSNIGHWEISKGAGSAVSQAYVTLYFDPVYDEVDDITQLKVAKGNPSSWVDLGGNVAGYAITSSIVFTTFSKFSLASSELISNPLPINLVNFTGECRNNKVWLNWTTSSEINNERFEIERSKDGFEFNKIGMLPGAGNSNTWLDYQFIDEKPEFAYFHFLYYRLKQIDFDSHYSYSETISVSKCQESYPTSSYIRVGVSENSITLIFAEPINETLTIDIIDNVGRTVQSHRCEINGSNTVSISRENLPSAMYSIYIRSQEKVFGQKAVLLK